MLFAVYWFDSLETTGHRPRMNTHRCTRRLHHHRPSKTHQAIKRTNVCIDIYAYNTRTLTISSMTNLVHNEPPQSCPSIERTIESGTIDSLSSRNNDSSLPSSSFTPPNKVNDSLLNSAGTEHVASASTISSIFQVLKFPKCPRSFKHWYNLHERIIHPHPIRPCTERNHWMTQTTVGKNTILI